MKTIPLILVISALLLTGCVQTQTIVLEEASEASFKDVNTLGARKKANIVLADGGTRWKVQSLQVTPDSTSWIGLGGELESAATHQIKEIRFGEKKAQGIMAASLLTGAMMGLAKGLYEEEGEEYQVGWFTVQHERTKINPTSLLIGVSAGALIGITISGVARSYQSRFKFLSLPSLEPPSVSTYYPPHHKATLASHRKQ